MRFVRLKPVPVVVDPDIVKKLQRGGLKVHVANFYQDKMLVSAVYATVSSFPLWHLSEVMS